MRAAVAAGRGVVTAQRLCALGIPGRVVAQWCRRGLLISVRRGVYTTRELWESWDEYVARPMARIRAADLTLRIPHVFSHDSAAIVQDVRLLRPQGSAVHITRKDVRGSRSRFGIEHHGAVMDPSRILRRRGSTSSTSPGPSPTWPANTVTGRAWSRQMERCTRG